MTDQPETTAKTAPSEKSEALRNFILFLAFAGGALLFWDQFKPLVMFLITLGALVAIHEWGHFIAARASGVHVYEFAIGMGPKLLTYMRRNGTEYTIRALPIGGFVNPKGMQPDDPITADGINGRRPAERALVYIAGPLMNVIVGVVIILLLGFMFGKPDPNQVLVANVERKTAAAQMEVVSRNGQAAEGEKPGLRVGDRILQINDQPVTRLEMVPSLIQGYGERPITLTVQRGGDTLQLTGTPQRRSFEQDFLTVTGVPEAAALDIRPGDQLDRINGQMVGVLELEKAQEVVRGVAGREVTAVVWRDNRRLELTGVAGPLELALKPGSRTVSVLGFQPQEGIGERVSLGESFQQGSVYLSNFTRQITAMFTRPKVMGESVGGPVSIFKTLGEATRLPAFFYASYVAQISLSLAIFNLLPIPVLDGGHITMLAVEVVRRRRLDPEMQKRVVLVGLAIMGLLFVLIMFKDFTRHVIG